MSQRTNPPTPYASGEHRRYGPEGLAGRRSFLDEMAAAHAGSPPASPADFSNGQVQTPSPPASTNSSSCGINSTQELQELVEIGEGGK